MYLGTVICMILASQTYCQGYLCNTLVLAKRNASSSALDFDVISITL